MELELGLALPSTKGLGFDLNGDAGATTAEDHNKKRAFTDAFGSDNTRPTLPLFVWASIHDNNTNNNHNHNSDGDRGCAVKADYIGRCVGTAPVGWPPVKSAWRNSGGARYVKVKMEGVAIGRKVDLSLHRSYSTLLDSLDRLFTRNNEEGGLVGLGGGGSPVPPLGNHRDRMFTYQVSGGDWMLLGDVPWERFVKSVKRLKILSCGE